MEFKFRIESNAAFFDIIRNKLYSDKRSAPVREYLCNAYDEHVLRGLDPAKVEVVLPTHIIPVLRIRDYGQGMNWQAIQDRFTTYFASDKTDGTVTGRLGLGCKSGFAYATEFTVASYQQGKKTLYKAYLDQSMEGRMDQLGTIPTEEADGLEISLPIPANDVDDFVRHALPVLAPFHPQPQITNAPTSYRPVVFGQYNEHQVGIGLVMGNILYSVTRGQMEQPGVTARSCNLFRSAEGMCLQVPLNSLDFTANREALEWTPKTVAGINAAAQQLHTLEILPRLAKLRACKTVGAVSKFLVSNGPSFCRLLKWRGATVDNAYSVVLASLPKEFCLRTSASSRLEVRSYLIQRENGNLTHSRLHSYSRLLGMQELPQAVRDGIQYPCFIAHKVDCWGALLGKFKDLGPTDVVVATVATLGTRATRGWTGKTLNAINAELQTITGWDVLDQVGKPEAKQAILRIKAAYTPTICTGDEFIPAAEFKASLAPDALVVYLPTSGHRLVFFDPYTEEKDQKGRLLESYHWLGDTKSQLLAWADGRKVDHIITLSAGQARFLPPNCHEFSHLIRQGSARVVSQCLTACGLVPPANMAPLVQGLVQHRPLLRILAHQRATLAPLGPLWDCLSQMDAVLPDIALTNGHLWQYSMQGRLWVKVSFAQLLQVFVPAVKMTDFKILAYLSKTDKGSEAAIADLICRLARNLNLVANAASP